MDCFIHFLYIIGENGLGEKSGGKGNWVEFKVPGDDRAYTYYM